jgi:phosphohistidine phosphatase SixA
LIASANLPFSVLWADLATTNTPPEFVVKPGTPALINQLRDGGYVLFMRHTNTDASKPDRLPNVDLNDCSTQRPLTEEGLEIARQIGRKIRKAKIPIGEVISSPMCRAKETAKAAFVPEFSVNNLLIFTSNMTDKDKAPVVEAARELISRPVENKANRVLVGHAQTLMEMIGYLPKPEGTIVVFKPMGDKHFKYIATIEPVQWNTLIHNHALKP